MSVHFLPGKRASSRIIHDGEGFFYYLDKVRNNKAYLLCIDKNCVGRCKTTAPMEEGLQMITAKLHCHDANPTYVQLVELKRKIFERSAYDSTTLRKIFDDECAK